MPLRQALKDWVRVTLSRFNLAIIRDDHLQRIVEEGSRASRDIGLLLELPRSQSLRLLEALPSSKSQLRQDLFVLSELDFKRNGFFVEFGATNGLDYSNTHLLEKEFGWTGILAEPAKSWHEDLRANRKSHVETDCVWRDSNSILTFNEVDIGEFSTIDSYSSLDGHRRERKHGKTYSVKTISLEDLLDKYHAPKEIDYLSIDTEGSEYEILSAFNFTKYSFKTITCEHNFAAHREKISSLLAKNGYVLRHGKFSKFDDWFVKADMPEAARREHDPPLVR